MTAVGKSTCEWCKVNFATDANDPIVVSSRSGKRSPRNPRKDIKC
jgi:hypothetical protein